MKSKEVDIYYDKEQAIKFEEILKILILAGYYRARIKGLENFDKIVGGMTWCIESCHFDVDVDILFKENLTIGQKIALTEKIVIMLPKMKCPYSIEPHQIQGLDSTHILPVIKWLIEESMRTRQNMSNYVNLFAVNRFTSKYLINRTQCESIKADNILTPDSELITSYVNPKVFEKIVNIKNKEVSKVSRQYFKSSIRIYQSKPLTSKKLITILEQKKCNLQDKKKKLVNTKKYYQHKITEFILDVEQYRIKNFSLISAVETTKSTDVIEYKGKTLQKLKKLLLLQDKLKDQENNFREQCRLDLNLLNNVVKKVKAGECQEEKNNILDYKQNKNSIFHLKLQLAKKNRSIASLVRQLDDVPNRSELTQYQRRFMELYNQVLTKHKETKQYYAFYNTLDDTKLYTYKELSLLNSIQDNYNEAMASSSGRDQFIRQFQIIVDEVQKNKKKMENRTLEEKNRRNVINQQLTNLVEQHRKYVAAVRQLTIECRKNEILLARLREL